MKASKTGLMMLLFGLLAGTAAGQAVDNSEDEKAVRAASQRYAEMFNSGNAEGIAAAWAPNAVYTNRMTGEQVIGRDQIAAQFKEVVTEDAGLKLGLEIESVRFVSPNVAVENGVASVSAKDGESETFLYSTIYVRSGDSWLIDRVTDDFATKTESNYEHLQKLEWMIGSWIDEDESMSIETECKWTKNQNFMSRSFTVSFGGQIEMSGIQMIGWDASKNQIRSWTFDSDGGFAEGTWSENDGKWFVRKSGTTAQGALVTSTNIVTNLDDDSFSLRSIERTVDGKLLPNVEEVIVVRQ